MTGKLFAGTSGFSYSAWRGVFYPDKLSGSKMLAYYSERLNGVEMNGSFYMTPRETTLTGWRDAAPPGFLFCMKGHRGLTYSSAAFDRLGLARDYGRRLGVLDERAGPVLVQFPPTRQRDAAHLDELLEALALPAAAEFRHESWFADDVYAVLKRHGAALVVTDEEKWPLAPRLELGPIAYYRLRRDYDRRALLRWKRELRAELASREGIHVYFKHEPQAPARALEMLS